MVNKFLYPNGGSETYVFKLGEELKRQGHEVQYFGMEHAGRVVGNRVEIYTANMDFHTGKLQKVLYPFKIIYSMEARKKIRMVLDDFVPDVVHINNFNFQLTPSILYEIQKYRRDTGRKVKVVFTAHDSQLVCPNHLMQQYISQERCTKCIGGNPWNCAKYKCIHGSAIKSILGSVEAWLYRKLKTYRLIDVTICPSYFLKNKLDTCSQIKGKIVVMHNFVDPMEYEGDKQKEVKPYVLYFGRFSKEKGIETLLEACKELSHIPFVFVGNGPLEKEVNETENIDNRGFQTGAELQKLICDAKFSVFPSECNENCPFSVMESVSYGTPVIGADIGGVPELIEEGKTGYLFQSGNAKELSEKIQYLWNQESVLEQMTAECQKVIFDTASSYCKKLLQYYNV